jgi:ABC-2 type transport system permease protein
MINTFRAEFKKFLTVRSTYIWTGLTFALVWFVAFYGFGYSTSVPALNEPGFMINMLSTVIAMFVTIATILAILLVAHEYRYNTITYTLTASPSRLRVLVAKIVVMLTYVTVMGVALLGLAYFATRFGLSLKGVSLGAQDIPLWDTLWRFAAYAWGYVLAGIIIAAIVRGLVGSIVIFFLIPVVEQMSTLLLKDNSKFLPFRSLDSILVFQMDVGIELLTAKAALGVLSIYLVIGLAAAAISFVHRDAS